MRIFDDVIIKRSMSSYGEKQERPSRQSHRAELSGLTPSQPSSFAPLLDPNALAAQTLLMPHSDLFRLDPALAALTGQTTALGSSSAAAGALLNAQTAFGNPLQQQLFAQNTANSFLNSALTAPLQSVQSGQSSLQLAWRKLVAQADSAVTKHSPNRDRRDSR